jgi:cathepsin A (carboxypeptidase C)
MMGMLTELGPCTLHPSSKYTVPNPYGWNNNASVIFLDQPAGTGLATLAAGRAYPTTDLEGAIDFQFLLNIFFNDIFAEYANHTIHLAAESYGGHWLPSYLHHILDSRAHNSKDAFWGNIETGIVVNGLFDTTAPVVGSYELLCTDFRGPIFNSTICKQMAAALPECRRLGEMCQLTGDGEICFQAFVYCEENVAKFYYSEVAAGRKSSYNSKSDVSHVQRICHM